MSNPNKTIADIVAEMRAIAENAEASSLSSAWQGGVSAATVVRLADDIEAAAKRERERVEADALAVGGIVEASRRRKQVGNAAALREALDDAVVLLEGILDAFERGTGGVYKSDMSEAIDKARAALSAPPRNCDRFDDLKSAQRHYIEHGCQKGLGMLVDGEIRKFPWKSQFEKWLFAPATEQKGGDDEQK